MEITVFLRRTPAADFPLAHLLDLNDHSFNATFSSPMFTSKASGNPEAVRLCTLYNGDCAEILPTLPDASVNLIVTSPPYNIGKAYERRARLDDYVAFQRSVIIECHRVLRANGSICWQVGNYVDDGEIVPIDSLVIPIFRELGMKIRSRIIWTFGHGMHCTRRLSGRHETVVWATMSDDYLFDLDAIRIPQKYPQKRHYKGPKKGELSGNPLGKNPGDVWEISNVKNRHPEKTAHPCQFPEELVQRLVLSLTAPGEIVLDPFAGSGTVGKVCSRLDRASILIERDEAYCDLIRERLGDGNDNASKRTRTAAPAHTPDLTAFIA
ncbi:site-specific DNA-methyltransferase [Agrobacterium rhizogenes]|nr:site-specific DNA-methyltransferase [Rhizobium rhizogenes]NTJ32135.1 site-specific DNA-methyltransferase [Rhizobium rhizogenes]